MPPFSAQGFRTSSISAWNAAAKRHNNGWPALCGRSVPATHIDGCRARRRLLIAMGTSVRAGIDPVDPRFPVCEFHDSLLEWPQCFQCLRCYGLGASHVEGVPSSGAAPPLLGPVGAALDLRNSDGGRIPRCKGLQWLVPVGGELTLDGAAPFLEVNPLARRRTSQHRVPAHASAGSLAGPYERRIALLESTVGRQELAIKLLERSKRGAPAANQALKVFVNASPEDKGLVACLIDLLRSALNLEASNIRATHVSGYGYSVGTRFDDKVFSDIRDARVFLFVVSNANSLSQETALATGGRLALNKPIFPLLVPGTTASSLPGPLTRCNALPMDSEDALLELVQSVAQCLDIVIEPPAVYLRHVKALSRKIK